MSSFALKYHQRLFDLVGKKAVFGKSLSKQLDGLEHRHRITLPPSVREFYSIRRAVGVLQKHNEAHPTPVKDLVHRRMCTISPADNRAPYKALYYQEDAAYHRRESSKVEIDKGSPGYIHILHENQSVCIFFVHINGDDDPPVYHNAD